MPYITPVPFSGFKKINDDILLIFNYYFTSIFYTYPLIYCFVFGYDSTYRHKKKLKSVFLSVIPEIKVENESGIFLEEWYS